MALRDHNSHPVILGYFFNEGYARHVDRLGDRVRLEQERVGYGWVEGALRAR